MCHHLHFSWKFSIFYTPLVDLRTKKSETAADPPHPYLPSYSLNLLIYSLTLPKLVNLQVTLRLFGQVSFLMSIY